MPSETSALYRLGVPWGISRDGGLISHPYLTLALSLVTVIQTGPPASELP